MAPISQNKQNLYEHTKQRGDWSGWEVKDLSLLSSILAPASLPLEEFQLVQSSAFINVSTNDSYMYLKQVFEFQNGLIYK